MRLGSRLGPIGALVFVVCTVIAVVVIDDYGGDEPQEVADYIQGGADRLGAVFLLITVGALGLLLFTSTTCDRLRRSTLPETALTRGTVASLANAAGAVSAGLMIVGAVLFWAPGEASSYEEGFEVGGEIGNLFSNAGYGAVVGGFMALGLFVVTTCLAGRSIGLLPSWLAWTGVVLGVLQLVAFTFFPMTLMLLWVLVAAIVLLVRRDGDALPSDRGLGTPAV